MAGRPRRAQKHGCFATLGRVVVYWQIGRIIINALREYNSKPATTIQR